jgi:outer membrane protein
MIGKWALVTGVLLMVQTTVAAPNAQKLPKNWNETLHFALTLNSKPRANDAILDAQKDMTNQARHGMYPTVDVGGSFGESYTDITQDQTRSSSAPRSTDVNLTFNWTLFQCGLQYFAYQAAQVNEEIIKDRFQSTKFFINNTKGNVVANSFEAYSSLVKLNEQMALFPVLQRYFDYLRPIAAQDADAKEALKISEIETQNLQTSFSQAYESAADVFSHWVTLPPSPQMVRLQDAINELTVPQTAAQAFKIAQQKSPDVKEAADEVRLAEIQIKIAQAALCPRVSASVVLDHSLSSDHQLDSHASANTASGMISISMPIFNLPAYDAISYQKKMLIADKLSQQAALEDAQFSLQQTYKDLGFQLQNQKTFQANLDDLLSSLENSKVNGESKGVLPNPQINGSVVNYVTAKLKVISSVTQAWISLSEYKTQLMRDKFSIQSEMGTIFDPK